MTPYSDLRQLFARRNLTIAIFYILNASLFLFILLGSFVVKIALQNPSALLPNFSGEDLTLMQTVTSPFGFFTFGTGFVVTTLIVILAFINRSRALKKLDDKISYLVYYLGIFWAIASIILEILLLGRLSPSSPFYLLIFGFLHLFTLRKAQFLKEK